MKQYEVSMIKELADRTDVTQMIFDERGDTSFKKGVMITEKDFNKLRLADEIVKMHVSLSDLDGFNAFKELDSNKDYFEDANWLLFQLKKDLAELYKQYKGME